MKEETTETQPQSIYTRWVEVEEEVAIRDLKEYDRVFLYWFTRQ